MKSKRIMIGCMSLVICLLALTACSVAGTGSQNDDRSTADEKYHTLYYKDITKRENVTAVFSSCNSQQTEEVRMEAVGKDEDGFTYSCKGDASSYHLVSFRYDQFSTAKVAFNPCVSGWYNSVHGILPYTYGCTDQYESHTANLVTMNDTLVYDNKMYDDVNLPFNGYDKIVHIWTPADYDPSSDEKYTTVYLLDGQGMIYLGFPGETLLDSEHADIQVQSMTAATGYKAIVVAVDTFGDPQERYSRLDELTPDLGELAYKEETQKFGNLLSDYFADSVVPYIQQHYNVYTDALHTSIAGKSLGGLEAFYMALEHPELFGTAGVFSPSFLLYKDDVWRSYLGQKSFDAQSPFLYFYCGNEVEDNGDVTDEMVSRIREMGYPGNRFVYHREAIGGHETYFWRVNFSEFLNAMVYQRVEPLENDGQEAMTQ